MTEKNEKMIIIEKGNREFALKFLAERFGEPISLEEAKNCCVACIDDDIVHTNPTSGEEFDFVHQWAGSGIYCFVSEKYTLSEILEIARKFDVFSSHVGCGAAALAHKHVLENPDSKKLLIELFEGNSNKVDEILAKVDEILAAGPDELGRAYSQRIAEMVDIHHEHLQVERVHHNHSAAVGLVDLANGYHGPHMQGKGAYVIDSAIDVVPTIDPQKAENEAVFYGLLSEQIARSGHSNLPKDAMFTILVVADEKDAALGRKVHSRIQASILDEGKEGTIQVMYFDRTEVEAAKAQLTA